jgi:hypothetical protein
MGGEWDGRGSGIWGRFGHANRRALIGPKSLYHPRDFFPGERPPVGKGAQARRR